MSTAISSTSAAGSANATTAGSASAMGKDQFLKLLITQLQNQDPLKPMEDSQFVAQLAQFSSLEQMTNVATTTESVYKNQAATAALTMIGKNVEWADTDSEITQTGKVDSISFIDGLPKLNIGKQTVEVSNVVKVY